MDFTQHDYLLGRVLNCYAQLKLCKNQTEPSVSPTELGGGRERRRGTHPKQEIHLASCEAAEAAVRVAQRRSLSQESLPWQDGRQREHERLRQGRGADRSTGMSWLL